MTTISIPWDNGPTVARPQRVKPHSILVPGGIDHLTGSRDNSLLVYSRDDIYRGLTGSRDDVYSGLTGSRDDIYSRLTGSRDDIYSGLTGSRDDIYYGLTGTKDHICIVGLLVSSVYWAPILNNPCRV